MSRSRNKRREILSNLKRSGCLLLQRNSALLKDSAIQKVSLQGMRKLVIRILSKILTYRLLTNKRDVVQVTTAVSAYTALHKSADLTARAQFAVTMSLVEKFAKSEKSKQDVSDLTAIVIGDELSNDERDAAYTEWAKTYDEDFLVTADYNGPAITADEVVKIIGNKLEVNICDFGCGTGNVGAELKKRGYKNIDGLDVNREMLEVAKSKGIYNNVFLEHLGEGTIESIPDDTYDLLTGVGNIFPNHITEDAFEELIRITKPGGNIVCSTIAKTLPKDFELRYKQLEGNGAWKMVSERKQPNFFSEEIGVIYHFEVLPKNNFP